MKTLAILGRQPKIGTAELECLYGSEHISPLGDSAVLLNIAHDKIIHSRLGGTIKLAKVLTEMPTNDWFKIEKFLIPACTEHEQMVPEGKLTIGLSAYGIPTTVRTIEKTALSIKKALRTNGRSVRIVPNKSLEISTPQVIHNNLTGPNGWELVMYSHDGKTVIAQTVSIQDIEGYAARDQARPKRDARVGMLPPKLAQTIVNLAATAKVKGMILDPFCGTGVVLQEASLMGFDVQGTDIEPRMIEYSAANIAWLRNTSSVNNHVIIEVGDATTHTWRNMQEVTAVACEGYLGLPFAHLPSDEQLQQSIQSSNTISKGFLKNLASQTEPGFRACIGVPAWHIKQSVKHLPCLTQLESIGWHRIQLQHADYDDLIYHREGQVVGRELLILVRS